MGSCQVTFGDTQTSKDILYEVMPGNHGDTLTSKDILYEVMSDILYEVMSGNLW
jgi:hypothetical protein